MLKPLHHPRDCALVTDALQDAGLLVFARQLGVCGVLPADLALQFVAGGLFQAGGLIEL